MDACPVAPRGGRHWLRQNPPPPRFNRQAAMTFEFAEKEKDNTQE
jgi:hypothetical protein